MVVSFVSFVLDADGAAVRMSGRMAYRGVPRHSIQSRVTPCLFLVQAVA